MTSPALAADPAVALLEQERLVLLAQLARIPAERQAERPAPDRWSALEVVEHVARVEGGLAKLFQMKAAEPVTSSADERAAAVLTAERAALVRGRAQRIMAPDRVHPQGGQPAAELLERFAKARAALVATYQATDAATLDGHMHPHPVFGPITLRSWVTLSAHHCARHAAQIAEIADGWGLPPAA